MHRIPRLAVLTAGAVLAVAAPAAAQAPCDPFGATFAGQVPTPKQVLGFDLGKRDVTTAESDRYLKAVDDASSRVITGTRRGASRAATCATRSSGSPTGSPPPAWPRSRPTRRS